MNAINASVYTESDPVKMRAVFEAQQETAIRWRQSTAAERIERIKRLREAMLARRDDFYAAFASDYRKPEAEVDVTELMPVLDEMRHAIGRVKRWMKPNRVWPTSLMIMTKAWVQYQPRGRVLIIAPWNYPLNLCFGPLVSALAAGNTVILKPSEMMPAVSKVMAEIIREVFPENEVALFEGSLPTSQALLDLPFDHIFFTGSPMVGKIVMAAAAKHLTSVTLELGGKSPTIVDETADLKTAAETLMWGKFLNAGQTCVAPDYLYVHDSVKDAFVRECRTILEARYGKSAGEQKASPDLTRIVNPRHAGRVAGLLQEAVDNGARLLTGGDVDVDSCWISPTLLDQVPPNAKVMEEEIFGPVLPIIAYDDLNQVIADINARPKPLALYLWSKNQGNIDFVMQNTTSGGACINHCMMQFVHGNLPFGGVNNSGIGHAHGHYGFKAFSHERAVVRSSFIMLVKLFFSPYDATRLKVIKASLASLKLPMP
ncbi:aldehyde dehydrogenase (NAD+) [Fluviicoccus keumensis]|uniref:Aldehyde dehydrogenase n=1 Tax=Fluviicoccus keumensis TaxID=1435465 RepID=A0A4Q7YNI1_9GAMM|nr:aldehyde dehydrogenase family protein [Fluviicoccus keumensis]RZU38423.1 aldehyde dehydrogenase (NAD+) [Fluviicoccus keumensis]